MPHGNRYTEPYSAPLRRLIGEQLGVPERLIHINAGSAETRDIEPLWEDRGRYAFVAVTAR